MTLLNSIHLDSPPETKLMSLIIQVIYLLNSTDLDSQPKALAKVISFMTQILNSIDSDLDLDPASDLIPFRYPVFRLEPESELKSLIFEICSHVVSLNSKWNKLTYLNTQVEVTLDWKIFSLKDEDATHFHCTGCNDKNHEEYTQTPVEIKHPLHPKHHLQLVLCNQVRSRECYCCEKDLIETFYFCSTCDFAMNIVCVEKQPILTIDNSKRHEHTLALFPRLVSLTCNVCALDDTSSAIYMCPPCDFFVHLRCINLPRGIKISRHPYRLSFTPSFHQRDFSCGVCRTKIDKNYRGYSCIKEGCSYVVHSRCGTQRKLWDGKEFEGDPEEIEEQQREPFVRITDGIIQHFGHQQNHLKLDKNTSI